MGSPQPDRPAELVLTAAVARAYFLDDRSKTDIATEFGLSRFKVARLLDHAREVGLVRIELDYQGDLDLDLSARLRAAYSLEHVLVVLAPENDVVALREHLSHAAARLLSEIVTATDVLGIAWARSLLALPGALTHLAPCEVVQLTGALGRLELDDSAVELVRAVARVARGTAYSFHAPMILPDEETAASLRRQPEVARTMTRYPALTKAVLGVGSWQRGQSTVVDAIGAREWRSLRDLGVRAELSGIQIDGEGRPVDSPLRARSIGISSAQLRAVPEVIAVTSGVEKAGAVRAAIRGGFVNSLITSTVLARPLLELAGRDR